MRILLIALSIGLLALLYRYWISDEGIREVWRLQQAVAVQQELNAELQLRNSKLEAEVADLKAGKDAIEERARSELGMKSANETFYQVVESDESVAQ